MYRYLSVRLTGTEHIDGVHSFMLKRLESRFRQMRSIYRQTIQPRDWRLTAKSLVDRHSCLWAIFRFGEPTPRFGSALYYEDEAHVNPNTALSFLLRAVQEAGVQVLVSVEVRISPSCPPTKKVPLW